MFGQATPRPQHIVDQWLLDEYNHFDHQYNVSRSYGYVYNVYLSDINVWNIKPKRKKNAHHNH